MAHEIDFSNGRSNIAYVGERPWHGLGQKLEAGASITEWTKQAGLDWQANSHIPYVKIDGEDVAFPERQFLVRSDTQAFLGSFTDHYVAAQPADILAFFNDYILTDERFQLETAGSLRGGRIIWALAKFNEPFSPLGEDHTPYINLATSFDGSLATTGQATVQRVVCANTLNASIYSRKAGNIRIKHNKEFRGVVQKEAVAQLAEVARSFKTYENVAEALAGIKLSADQTEKLFTTLIPAPEAKEGKKVRLGNHERAIADLNDLLHKTWQEGAEKGRAWAAFNAVTDYVDHVRTTRRTNGSSVNEARADSAFFGSGAALKGKALDYLLDTADIKLNDLIDA